LSITKPTKLNLPNAKNNSTEMPDVILLGFDALDGDTGNRVIEEKIQGWGGRIYSNAYTPLPLTNPAWNSILTGLYPEHHRVRFFFDSPQESLHPDLYLATQLKSAENYTTFFASDQPETSYFTEKQGFENFIFAKIGWQAHLSGMILNHFIFPALWLNNSF